MIGIFDSGVGGLTVVREIKRRMPGKSFIYFGDTARFPWGSKSRKLIRQYSAEICNFLIAKGVKEIIIACNTASSLAGDFLQRKYTKIKFYNVVDPVVIQVEKEMHRKNHLKIGVIGTSATIRSKSYENRLRKNDPDVLIYSKACPLFAPLVEENWIGNKIVKKITKEYLKGLKKTNIDVLVLGCTHYPLLKKTIADYVGKGVKIISSAEEVAKLIKENSKPFSKLGRKMGKERYYFSDWTEKYKEATENILGEKIDPKLIKIVNHI